VTTAPLPPTLYFTRHVFSLTSCNSDEFYSNRKHVRNSRYFLIPLTYFKSKP